MLSGAIAASLDSAVVVAAAVVADGVDDAYVADCVLDGYGDVPEPVGVVAPASTSDVDGLDAAAAVDECAPVVLLSAVCGSCVSNAGSLTQDGVVGASGLYDDEGDDTAGRRRLVDSIYAFSDGGESGTVFFASTEIVKNAL